jgi:hypothetical protein
MLIVIWKVPREMILNLFRYFQTLELLSKFGIVFSKTLKTQSASYFDKIGNGFIVKMSDFISMIFIKNRCVQNLRNIPGFIIIRFLHGEIDKHLVKVSSSTLRYDGINCLDQ